ncbi:MerR family transcriptional regulator [Rhodococcus sp. NPDC060084]|uniref:MerR family transcriptional regulator n=1 Tax=Rhodococcus sp. NPDC060084 TaxID=3347053 RepID=UPI00365DD0C3
MLISQFAEHTGVPATTLRYYESAGLVPAGRTDSGYRIYRQRDLDRVGFIQAAKHLGLSLGEIRELLAVWEHGSCAAVRARLRPKTAARLDDTDARTAELIAFADTLRRALSWLDDMPERAEPCDATCVVHAPDTRSRAHHLPLTPSRVADNGGSATPIACSLGGADHRTRAQQWRRLLIGAVREPSTAGVRLRLPVDRAGALARLAAAEQQCCPFFEFTLRLSGSRVVLEVEAPPEAAGMVRELFGEDTHTRSDH